MSNSPVLLVGSTKGLVLIKKGPSNQWKIEKVVFKGFNCTMVYVDERNGRWWIGISHKHWGQKLHYSDDRGTTWQEANVPNFRGALLPGGQPAKLRQAWCMQHGGWDRPGSLWLGTDPGGLFYSQDHGISFELVQGLWQHPSRQVEGQWFGAGSDHPFIHSIVLDPKNSDHLFIAVSCAGVFETWDNGHTWKALNNGLKAAYLPNPKVEVGHDPHRMLMPGLHNQVLWQQNHCGVFYSDSGGKEWIDVSSQDGLPSYGFALAVDEEDPACAWVIPAESDENRVAPGLVLQVFETKNYGESWENVSAGLPIQFTFDLVLRQAFARKGEVMAFGTTNGNLYLSEGTSVQWETITTHLAKVNVLVLS